MAHSTLAVSSEKYSGNMLDQLCAIVDSVVSPREVSCAYESPESAPGACDGGFPCYEPAVEGRDCCAKHEGAL